MSQTKTMKRLCDYYRRNFASGTSDESFTLWLESVLKIIRAEDMKRVKQIMSGNRRKKKNMADVTERIPAAKRGIVRSLQNWQIESSDGNVIIDIPAYDLNWANIAVFYKDGFHRYQRGGHVQHTGLYPQRNHTTRGDYIATLELIKIMHPLSWSMNHKSNRGIKSRQPTPACFRK